VVSSQSQAASNEESFRSIKTVVPSAVSLSDTVAATTPSSNASTSAVATPDQAPTIESAPKTCAKVPEADQVERISAPKTSAPSIPKELSRDAAPARESGLTCKKEATILPAKHTEAPVAPTVDSSAKRVELETRAMKRDAFDLPKFSHDTKLLPEKTDAALKKDDLVLPKVSLATKPLQETRDAALKTDAPVMSIVSRDTEHLLEMASGTRAPEPAAPTAIRSGHEETMRPRKDHIVPQRETKQTAARERQDLVSPAWSRFPSVSKDSPPLHLRSVISVEADHRPREASAPRQDPEPAETTSAAPPPARRRESVGDARPPFPAASLAPPPLPTSVASMQTALVRPSAS